MKWFKLLGIPFIVGVVFYLIGNILPFRIICLPVNETPIDTSEYLSFIIGFIGTIVTFLAVLVALFKEDIRKLWENVSFSVTLCDPPINEKLSSEEVGTSDGSKTNYYKAVKYHTLISIENKGRLAARNCEIYAEMLSFEPASHLGKRSLEVPDIPIPWNDQGSTNILIPPKGKKTIPILEIYSPKKQSSPDGKEVEGSPKLRFGATEISSDLVSGSWIGNFVIYAENVEPYRFSICLNWDGKWAQRLTEMKNSLTITIK